ncbi:MAG: hypothetical protein JW750_06275 [Anaerolineaceae bacterium]|nr:hypothetical protein [Anaerolineaceae bacterium]
MRLRIALAQIFPKLGDVEANLEKHLEFIRAAKENNADVVIFPELSLTGYALQDLASYVARKSSKTDPIIAKILEASKEIDIICSYVEEDVRSRFFISASYFSKGKILHTHHKVYLPTYGLFDEGRFFAWGDSVRAFDTPYGRVSLLICEDFWHSSLPYLLWLDGSDIFFMLSASPGRGLTESAQLDTARWVNQINQAYAGLFTSFVVHVNRVGYEDGLNFWGCSSVFDPNGKEVAKCPDFEETLSIVEIDLGQIHRTRSRLPLLRDERTNLVSNELKRILGEN